MIEMVETKDIMNSQLVMENYGLLPFNRAVSKYNIEEDVELDIVTRSRKIIDYNIAKLIRITSIDQATRFQPIIGDAGTGKTHYYWILKSREEQFTETPYKVIYVSSPPTPYRLMHHVYSCLVDEIADERFFLNIADVILEELGIDSTSIDIHTDSRILIAKILPTFPGIFADSIKALMIHKIYGSNRPRGALALRWLFGEGLTEEELKELQIRSILEQDDVCLAMIKIISDLCGRVLIFYFDEMESPYRTFGPEAQQKFFEYIKRLYNELRNSLIVTSCLRNIWEEILKTADKSTLSRMEIELTLDRFKLEDVKVYYLKSMNIFWGNINQIAPQNEYFPLKEKDIEEIYQNSNGNQRRLIKTINSTIENRLFGYIYEQPSLQHNEQTTKHSTFNKGIQQEMFGLSNSLVNLDKQMRKKSLNVTNNPNNEVNGLHSMGNNNSNNLNKNYNEEYDIEEKEPSPGNVMHLVIQEINKQLINHDVSYDLLLDYSYKIDNKTKKLGTLLDLGSKFVGIEIPSIKTFEKEAGVAAYYAVKRLVDAKKQNVIQNGIIVIPSNTDGNKYRSMLEQNPEIFEIKIEPEKIRRLLNDKVKDLKGIRKQLDFIIKCL